MEGIDRSLSHPFYLSFSLLFLHLSLFLGKKKGRIEGEKEEDTARMDDGREGVREQNGRSTREEELERKSWRGRNS